MTLINTRAWVPTAHDGRLAVDLASQAFDTVRAAKDCEDKTRRFIRYL
jgi:hypothetical protein